MSNISLQHDLYTMFQEQQVNEFNEWVNSIEEHVSTLKNKVCKSCNKKKLEVVSMHKAKCTNCNELNNF